jgi:hypothetical protein
MDPGVSPTQPSRHGKRPRVSPTPDQTDSEPAGFKILTWNASNLSWGSHETALLVLLDCHDPDVVVMTEAELTPDLVAASFALDSYDTFFPLLGDPAETTCMIALVKSSHKA